MKHHAITLLLLLAALVAAPSARADGDVAPPAARADGDVAPPAAGAAELKRSADAEMDQLRYAEALALYEQAYALDANPALLYNQGRALEALGDYPAALDRLEKFERAAPDELRARVPRLGALIADLRSRVSVLVVRVNVPRAQLSLRDKDLGPVDGVRSVPARAGAAIVKVTAEGYEPFEQAVTLPARDSLRLDVELIEKREAATLAIKTTPAHAALSLNGKPLGLAPLTTRVAAGSYTIEVSEAGYVTQRVPLSVRRGEERVVEVELHTPPPITAKWWFWTGIGVVVAGATVTAIALTTEASPGTGSFSPGQVRF